MAEKRMARKQQAQQMRARIQSVALDLFNKEGFENVSVEEIAQAAGCSVGNIYHYFKSKDELAIQLTDNVDRLYLELEQEYKKDTVRTAKEKLLDFIGQTLRISSEEEVLYKSFIQGLKYPEQGALKDGGKRVYHRMLREMVAECQREGSISDAYSAAEIAQQLVVLHRGMLFEWRIYEHKFDLVQRGVTLGQILLRGLEK